MGNRESMIPGKKSQAAQLKKLVRQALISVVTGVVLLLGFILFNMTMSRVHNAQLNTTAALNQYRIGSKTLTYNIQSYAVTGNQEYYDGYMKELNEDRNRENAIETLKSCDITDDEWSSLNQIASMSENLVPLEKEAIAHVQEGSLEAAQACVFSTEYGNAVNKISRQTDETILEILNRKGRTQAVLKVLQVIFEILFAFSFLYVVMEFVRTIRFSEKELLEPIQKVSD
ncbi:MAG: methyl-accepting chemotaxis protein, partial [Lachnospiraceae bacterium]|nr:methyl-accepting chemotaxis protein [Lachnospiraceae bacterium]